MKFYKYRAFGKRTNNILINSSLYFSPIKYFNDPFDCRLSYRKDYSDQELEIAFDNFKKRNNFPLSKKTYDTLEYLHSKEQYILNQEKTKNMLIDKLGILALSTNYKKILMWSHYSQNHTGLVFEFTPLKNTNCFLDPIKVDYEHSYEPLSYVSDNKHDITKIMLTKHIDWKYEEEYRVVKLFFQGEKKFHKKELTSIIFGALAKEEDIKYVISLCKKNGFNHLKFKKAKLVERSFQLEFININI